MNARRPPLTKSRGKKQGQNDFLIFYLCRKICIIDPLGSFIHEIFEHE